MSDETKVEEVREPTPEENREYGIAVIAKQGQKALEHAADHFDALPAEHQTLLVHAGRNAQLAAIHEILAGAPAAEASAAADGKKGKRK